ncbi:MAG: hypothetical protein ACFCVK_17355 [Acidimicrobiales bacterium]
MSSSPQWRQAFDAWEKAVAPGLEELTASAGFQDVLAVAARMNAQVLSETERWSRRWLHLWNLPAASDVRGLRRQIASLEREVKTLRRSFDGATPLDGTAPTADATAAGTAARRLDLVETDTDDIADAS